MNDETNACLNSNDVTLSCATSPSCGVTINNSKLTACCRSDNCNQISSQTSTKRIQPTATASTNQNLIATTKKETSLLWTHIFNFL